MHGEIIFTLVIFSDQIIFIFLFGGILLTNNICICILNKCFDEYYSYLDLIEFFYEYYSYLY